MEDIKSTDHIKQLARRESNPLRIMIIIGGFVFMVIVVAIIAFMLRKNPYGPQIKIENFNKYYSNIPTNTRDAIYNALYNIADMNNPSANLTNFKANIRDGSATETYNQITDIYSGTFLIDISELNQTYKFQVFWSPNPQNPNLESGYPIVASCPNKSELIDPGFVCIDGISGSPYDDPAFAVLPITVSSMSHNYSEYTSYELKAELNDESVVIIINDITGNNYNTALAKLRSLGLNPDDYTIEYHPPDQDIVPGRAPNDAKI